MILVESKFGGISYDNSEKNLYIKGIFMESEQKNKNGRTYKKQQIEDAVKLVNESAANGHHILGALDHPSASLEVKLSDVSHRIDEMYMDGNNAVGKAMIIESVPNGQIAKGLIEAGINIGVSSRGSGSVNESTGIVEDYDFVTIDLVATPSAHNAYPTSIRESIEKYYRSGVITDLSEAVIHDPKAQKYFKKELTNYIKSLFN